MDHYGIDWDPVVARLQTAVDAGDLPGAVFGAAGADAVLLQRCVGFRQVEPERLPLTLDTIFDLASLTKVVATTSLVFRGLEQGAFRLDDPVSRFLPADFGTIRLSHLLTHASGLPGWLDLTHAGDDAELRLRRIARASRHCLPGQAVLYSDLNFILLGMVLEQAMQDALPALFRREVAEPLGLAATGFLPSPDGVFAATEWDQAAGGPLVGVVHDENARAAGGVLGHAGLFGTLGDLLTLGQAILRRGEGPRGRWLSAASVAALEEARTVGLPGELRAYGYQKPHPGSSAGDLMSPRAIGHTGFTGTSLWIDPRPGVVMVLLTNRVHFGRVKNAPIRLRPIFHNMVLARVGQEINTAEDP